MAERVRIGWVSPAGVGHVDEFIGDLLVGTVDGTTATVRVHNGGRLVSVHTFTGVSRVDWYPDGPQEGGDG